MNPLEGIEFFPIFAGEIPPPMVKQKQLKRHRANCKKEQTKEAFETEKIHKESILAKLHETDAADVCASRGEKWFGNFVKCGNEKFVMMCDECRRVKECSYKCSNRFCPNCAWRIAAKRRELITAITKQIYEVKHVVLTQRNFYKDLTGEIRKSRANLAKIRRQKFWGRVTGGCASLELTNEEKGWHLHWHVLVQSQFVDAQKLAVAWGKLVGQDYAIVKVLPVGEKSYVHETCKYVAKGSDIAKWTGKQILEFILALRDVRSFGTFGKFRQMQKFARAMIELEKIEEPACECGCTTKTFAADESAANHIIDKIYS